MSLMCVCVCACVKLYVHTHFVLIKRSRTVGFSNLKVHKRDLVNLLKCMLI